MSSRNQSPRGTATPQKKVQIQTQQANGSINSQPKTLKSPQKGNSSKGGSRSPPHSPSQSSRQTGTQPSGSRRQSPQSSQRPSSKNVRKQSIKGKQGEKQPAVNQDGVSQKNTSNNTNKVFYDKKEIREAMSSPKQLEDYWNYQESVERRILDYKEKADQNLRKISEYNDKLRRIQQKCFDFDSVRDDIYSYKSQKRYHKSETEDSFQQTNEDQYDKKGYSTQVKLSPSNLKQVGFGTERNRSQDRQALQYKIQQHEAYEKILNSKLKNGQNLNDLVDLEKSIQLEKMGLQYFSKKIEDQIYQKQQINREDSLRLSNDLYNQSPSKTIKKHVNLQQESKPEEFQQYKQRRNSTTQNQNDRFNTFQAYNNKKLEEEIQSSQLKEFFKKPQIDRSQLLTPEENELISSCEKKLNYSPKSSKNYRDLSNEKTPNSNQKYDANRLTNLQYKYLLEKHDYEKFLNGKLDDDENTNNKGQVTFGNQKNNQNGLHYSDGKYRKKSITRLDTQQQDNFIRNRLGLTEDLSNAVSRKSNHYPHSSQQQQKGERVTTNETNFTFLPNIQDNRRVSLDTNQINQNKYLRNLEIENLFQNQQKSNIFQRHSTPTNKHYNQNKF
ncbi:hypothetical protein ABPG72_008411 [Tetrahymena utriculariae]